MRKHSRAMCSRWTRAPGDRSNAPSVLSHSLANNKAFQFAANSLLQAMLRRI